MIEVKEEIILADFLEMHPSLFIIIGYFLQYARFNKLPVVLTSMFSDLVPNRVSNTHLSGRAVDASVRGWDDRHKKAVVAFVDGKVSYLGAVGKDAKRRCIIVHDSGSGEHFHIQCAP